MINELQIFTRKNNTFNRPSLDWNLKSKIYVSGKINLGLGDEIIFDQHSAPTLKKVIQFIKRMTNSSNVTTNFKSKNNTIEIVKTRYDLIEIYYIYNDKKVLKLRKEGYFDLGIIKIKEDIYNQIANLNKELRNYLCEYIMPFTSNNFVFNFRRGDLVKTSKVSSIHTFRKGMIYSMQYHYEDKKNYYQISINGKVHNRRYTAKELVLNEPEK